MKKLFIIFALLSAQLLAQYTTPNTGVNWNLDDLVTNSGGTVAGMFPNYIINNKVTISALDRVYVIPGSSVVFSGSASGFEIYGKFVAVGNPADSIVFTAAVEDSLGGSFNGFYFRESSVDTACIISYARIEFAYYGLRCLGASPTLSYSYLWKCRRGANLSSDSHPVISHNRIERSYEYGITMTTGCSPLIEYNEIINNNSQNTSPKNQISIGTQGNNSPIIKHNKIRGGMFNKTGGISIATLISGSSSSAEIAYNEVSNNSFGIAMQGTYPVSSYIHDNLIYDNNINPDVMTSGSGINAYGTAVLTPVICRNTIYGNWWGVTIQIGIAGQPGPQVNLGNIENSDTTDDGRNTIFNNVQGTAVYDLYNNTLETVYAQNNDWKVYDSTLIEDHIFHFVDDPTLGLVKFIPFYTATFSFTVDVTNGWNMVSIPGILPGPNPNAWWAFRDPGANIFKYNGGYQSVTNLFPTEGYWMKHIGARTYEYSDIQIVPHDPIYINSGWNLIGLYEIPTDTADLETLPQGIIVFPVYRYFGGYQIADTLKPGYAYWVKSSAYGQIVFNEGINKSRSSVISEFISDSWGKIIITDASCKSYTLYSVKGEIDINRYELPPKPPEGLFDIRYSSGRIAEDINSSVKTIDMSGVTYPLTVRVEGMDIRLMDESGKNVNVNLKSGEDVVIDNSNINKLMVSGELVPAQYSLEQNYPNPFNPSTTIKYSLARDEFVKLVVYNTLGEEVTTLVNKEQKAGRYEVIFSASDLATGVYVYRIETPNYTASKKLILMK
ncbi:MAG: T9SS type A sorting domain-containing protein [Ignavibacteriaceae bacterium]|nr:T9SS type A sorting domain-containing protein [Ignavibacteriaceae bacterium]